MIYTPYYILFPYDCFLFLSKVANFFISRFFFLILGHNIQCCFLPRVLYLDQFT